jgi:enoyl-CoA hydratase/carnithine racemase
MNASIEAHRGPFGVEPICRMLRARPAVTATKEQLLRHADTFEVSPAADVERLEKVCGAPDFRQGVRAFLAKDKPRFGQA